MWKPSSVPSVPMTEIAALAVTPMGRPSMISGPSHHHHHRRRRCEQPYLLISPPRQPNIRSLGHVTAQEYGLVWINQAERGLLLLAVRACIRMATMMMMVMMMMITVDTVMPVPS